MFNRLEINGEKVPEGQQVRIIRDRSSWWVQPASRDAYVIAALLIVIAVLLAILVAG